MSTNSSLNGVRCTGLQFLGFMELLPSTPWKARQGGGGGGCEQLCRVTGRSVSRDPKVRNLMLKLLCAVATLPHFPDVPSFSKTDTSKCQHWDMHIQAAIFRIPNGKPTLS